LARLVARDNVVRVSKRVQKSPSGGAQGAFVIADTLDGDELVFLPTDPNTLLLLPREDEVVSETGLLPALTRLMTSESGRVPAKLTYVPMRDGEVT
jgi:hypothetical protein